MVNRHDGANNSIHHRLPDLHPAAFHLRVFASSERHVASAGYTTAVRDNMDVYNECCLLLLFIPCQLWLPEITPWILVRGLFYSAPVESSAHQQACKVRNSVGKQRVVYCQ